MEGRTVTPYEPLSTIQNQIRLVKLKPESDVDQVQCLLEVFNMEKAGSDTLDSVT